MPLCICCGSRSSVRPPPISQPAEVLSLPSQKSSEEICTEIELPEDNNLAPVVYWRFSETPDRRTVYRQTDKELSYQTRNVALLGLSQIGCVVTTCLTAVEATRNNLVDICNSRWTLDHKCPCASENDWGERGLGSGSVRFGLFEHGAEQYTTVVHTWGVIATPEKIKLKPWSFELWMKLYYSTKCATTTWNIARLAFATFGGPSFAVWLQASLSLPDGDLIFSVRHTSSQNGSFKFEPLRLDDSSLFLDVWMFAALVVPSNRTSPTLYVLHRNTWHTLSPEGHQEGFGKCPPTATLNRVEVGSAESREFEATEIRYFACERDFETVQNEAMQILPDAVQSQSNLIRKIQIRSDTKPEDTNDDKLAPPPPIILPPLLSSERSKGSSDICDDALKRSNDIEKLDEEKSIPGTEQQQSQIGELNISTLEETRRSAISLQTSRSLDSLDREVPTTEVPTTEVPTIKDNLTAIEKEPPGKEKPFEKKKILHWKSRAEKVDKSGTLEDQGRSVPSVEIVRPLMLCQQIESLFASKFLREVGSELLLSPDTLPAPPLDEDWNDPLVVLISLNHYLLTLHRSILSCRFLTAIHLHRRCLRICGPVILKCSQVDSNKTPPNHEVSILPIDRECSSLGLGVSLRSFDANYITRLKRSSPRLIFTAPEWRRFYFSELLQSHLASLTRCMLVVRLCLAALWVLFDISVLLEDGDVLSNGFSQFRKKSKDVRGSGAVSEFENGLELRTRNRHLDGEFVWEGKGWRSVSKLIELSECGELGPAQKIALEYLWIDLIGIFALIYSVGLPFGLPYGFESTFGEVFEELNLFENVAKTTDRPDNVLPIDFCFLSGCRLGDEYLECPTCCGRFCKTELLGPSNVSERRRCPYCVLGVITPSTTTPTTTTRTGTSIRCVSRDRAK